jgi:formiminotetrahydrofolate cyclodeaminase
MRDLTITDFLDQLAGRVPAPGGGASAALHAAQAASLIAMVARYSDGEKYSEHRAVIERIREQADELRRTALDLAEQDADTFAAVAAAYQLPRISEHDKSARSAMIARALLGAAEPPARVIDVAECIVKLGQELCPIANRNVITDVAAATDAARAAATTARLNVEVNLAGIADEGSRRRLHDIVDAVDDIARRADLVSASVREMISA